MSGFNDRVLATAHGQFMLREWRGKNTAGIQPMGNAVLVLVDPAMEKTKGGIIMTEQKADQQTLASTTGLVAAIGDAAFAFTADRTAAWSGRKPVVGDRVYFQRYAGQEYTGLDGEMYRLMEDRSIAGLEVPVEAAKAKGKAA